MSTLIEFIQTYGYLTVFIGSVFEGETVVTLGGLSAHEAYVYFPLVVLSATLGALVSDWGFFFMGRYRKQAVLHRLPWLARLMRTPTSYIEHRPRVISFGMRFMYGFRHIVPFSIGASNVPASQFMFWNGLGALLWALAYTTGGYVLGTVLETLIGDIRKYEFRIIVVALLSFMLFHVTIRMFRFVWHRTGGPDAFR